MSEGVGMDPTKLWKKLTPMPKANHSHISCGKFTNYSNSTVFDNLI